jgi:hypothetical protein
MRIRNFFDPGSGVEKCRSGIQDKFPESATLGGTIPMPAVGYYKVSVESSGVLCAGTGNNCSNAGQLGFSVLFAKFSRCGFL